MRLKLEQDQRSDVVVDSNRDIPVHAMVDEVAIPGSQSCERLAPRLVCPCRDCTFR
jgi:hypothetical protein